MLDSKGFDLWASSYDESVGLSDADNSYPFAGYKEVLGKIYQTVLGKENARVLDIGFGTGVLTAGLYERGCDIWGQDFSAAMIESAQKKMPRARLYQGDFSRGLAAPLCKNTYDFIIATYSLHHLTLDEKLHFIRQLLPLLAQDGVLLIGDIAFGTADELEHCREEAGDEWDDEEIYFVYDELKEAFPHMEFEKVSHCAGLMALRRGEGGSRHDSVL